MTEREPLSSELVARFGLALFGPEWAAALARLTRTNERTVRRIRAAADDGKEYPAARGVLAALYEALDALRAELQPFSRR